MNVVQYIIREDSFWTDFLVFYRQFYKGQFDDHDFEVMAVQLRDYQSEHEEIFQDRMKVLAIYTKIMIEQLEPRERKNHAVDMISVDNKIILAYAYQN
jgi:hypothetical protein